ncbi:uncharacterized protein BYT42DRAFT_551022 [Radiomyces spectabilis]|uniref:uncharacterized protein n=1 Tax=Radiomyces spectabilis TaxID=64574 RepID=UPI00221F9585|nr:uncharacterized protein BYT42DRAFT_551022 [Radiomyces spectabilis]KAI8393433.1 hypothetical protein BYT42DRAFT_551022 [Radiomyces spectabilis]
MTFVHSIAHKVKSKVKEGVYELTHRNDQEEQEREKAYLAASHRFGSFAPVRDNAQVKYYIDGHDYCWAVSQAIEEAEECVFIEDWWLSPELYLRRPPAKYPEYRIDQLLKRKAEQGVMIFVVVYKEVELAMPLDSMHTKRALQALHSNIIVQRHPDHAIGGTFFWSHHEKFVVIDNKIAFLGGIDLCFGRWDTHTHRLADFHTADPGMEMFPGQDYNDARVRDFKDVKDWDMRLIDKTVVPRMPWHDMSMCMLGGPVLDVARHFCERWNYIKHEKGMDKKHIPFLEPPLGGFGNRQAFKIPLPDRLLNQTHHYRHHTRGQRGTCNAQVLRSSAEWSSGIQLEKSIQTAYIETINAAQHYVYIENQFFITTTEDDPNYILKNQIGQALVNRIVKAFEEGQKFKVFVLIPLMPAFPADLSTKEAATARLVMHYQYVSICRGSKSIFEKLKGAGINPEDYIRFYSLRSYDRINRRKLEEMLAQAAGYTPSVRVTTEDEVEVTKVQNEDDFIASDSVGYDSMKGGDLESEPWVTDTASQKHRSPENERQEASDYVSEELYIHAKLLIADDRVVIMGSANLNDRSQCGDRDSEIAMIVEDQDMIASQMNGEPYPAARFAATLRRQLWKEHLGLLPDQPLDIVDNAMLPLPVPQIDWTDTEEDRMVMDPLDEDTLSLWYNTAATNTEAFRNVFHCVPEASVTNWDQYKAFAPDPEKIEIGHIYDPNMSVKEIRQNLSRIRGHLVEFPYTFLENINLKDEAIPFIDDAMQELYT